MKQRVIPTHTPLCAAFALLASACGVSVGKPYNALLVPQLKVGQSTASEARRLLDAPYGAIPLRRLPGDKAKCPNATEQWSYLYTDLAEESCSTTLEFDENGQLCFVDHTPPTGEHCSGEE